MTTFPSIAAVASGTESGADARAATDDISATPLYTRHVSRLILERLLVSSIRSRATIDRWRLLATRVR